MIKAIYTTPNKEWEAYHAALKCMGIIILDKYYNSNTNSTTDKSVINERLKNTEDRTILQQQFLDECWIRKGINYTYMLDSSIVDSSEAYSYKESLVVTEDAFKSSTFLDTKHLLWWAPIGNTQIGLCWCTLNQLKQAVYFPISRGWKKKRNLVKDSKSFWTITRKQKKAKNIKFGKSAIQSLSPHCQKALKAKILNYFQLLHSSSNPEDKTSGFKACNGITTELYCKAFGEDSTPHSRGFGLPKHCVDRIPLWNPLFHRVGIPRTTKKMRSQKSLLVRLCFFKMYKRNFLHERHQMLSRAPWPNRSEWQEHYCRGQHQQRHNVYRTLRLPLQDPQQDLDREPTNKMPNKRNAG